VDCSFCSFFRAALALSTIFCLNVDELNKCEQRMYCISFCDDHNDEE